MIVRASLAAMIVMVSLAAQAEHAVAPETNLVAASTREICTEIVWGYDGVRTDCRFKVLAAEAPNPALWARSPYDVCREGFELSQALLREAARGQIARHCRERT